MNDNANKISVPRCTTNAKMCSVGQGGQKGHLLVSTFAENMEYTIAYCSVNIHLCYFVLYDDKIYRSYCSIE